MPGLYLVTQPSGAKAWAVRYRIGGKPAKFTIGAWPAFGVADARREASTILQQVARGEDPAHIKRERQIEAASAVDFATAARLWVEREQRPKRRAWKGTARVIGLAPDADGDFVIMRGDVVDRWGKRRLADISRTDVIHLIDEVAARAPYMANRLLAHLKSLFNFLIARDMVQANPCIGVKPQPEEARDRILSDDELVRAWHAASDLGWPHGPIVRLLILTGQRRDEVSGMRWAEVDFDQQLWKLPRERVKNNTAHEIPLSAPALDVLRRLERKSQRVFLRPGLTQVSGFSKAKARLDTISSVADWRLHDLRRTVASGMARLGVSLPVVEKVLNHTSGSFAGIVGVYQRHDFAGEKRDALDRWAGHVVGLVEGKPANVVA